MSWASLTEFKAPTRENYQRNITKSKEILEKITAFRVVSHTKLAESVTTLYGRIFLDMNRQAEQCAQATVSTQREEVQGEEVQTPSLIDRAHEAEHMGQLDGDLFCLRCFPRIPAVLEADPILEQYICPITGSIIRDPVEDPTSRTISSEDGTPIPGQLFEREAILQHLNRNPTSPITRRPLHPRGLISKPDVKTQINLRLEFHQSRFIEHIQSYITDESQHQEEGAD